MKSKAKDNRPKTFREAVQATPAIAKVYQPGIQALLPVDKKRLLNADKSTGSVELDEALRTLLPNDNRWDYGIGLPADKADMADKTDKTERVLWLEVHHGASGQTALVLKKLHWLRSWLRNHAPELNRMQPTYVWLLSNVENNPNDRRKRNQLAEKEGLRRHQGKLDLATING